MAAPIGLAGGAGAPGVTPVEIRLGGTAALCGSTPAPALAQGADAYFEWVNARGGVDGRRIAYRCLDDAADAAQAVAATRSLVEDEGVLAVVVSVGTEQSLAVREYLNALGVPQLYVASGARTFGADGASYPWTIGFQPTYRAEGRAYGTFLARARRGAKVAALLEDGADGRELLGGLKRAIRRSTVELVALETLDPGVEVEAAVAALQASGADTLALFATPPLALDAYAALRRLGWRPFVVLSAASAAATTMLAASERGRNRAVEGSVSSAFLKDPSDPRWANDSAMALYRAIMRRYGEDANARDVSHVYGMAVAYQVVEALRQTGKNVTRAGLLRSVASMTTSSNPFLLPGILVRTGAGDRFPIEQLQLQRWEKGRWNGFGGLWRLPAR